MFTSFCQVFYYIKTSSSGFLKHHNLNKGFSLSNENLVYHGRRIFLDFLPSQVQGAKIEGVSERARSFLNPPFGEIFAQPTFPQWGKRGGGASEQHM